MFEYNTTQVRGAKPNRLAEAKKIVDDLRSTGVTLAIPLSIEIQQVGA